MVKPGVWLDPEPAHAEHSEVQCRDGLPTIRSIDFGRRFRCGVCGRAYKASTGHQLDRGGVWVRHAADDQVP